jgi:hypothetical protein
VAVGEGRTSAYHNGVRHFFLNLARRVAFRGRRQEALVVPFFVLDAKAHNVALVKIQLCVIVAPDVDLFVLFTVQESEGGEWSLFKEREWKILKEDGHGGETERRCEEKGERGRTSLYLGRVGEVGRGCR